MDIWCITSQRENNYRQGATEAVKKGFSMLSAGIVSTEGNYEKGDLIQIVDEQQNFVGKGLIHFIILK